MSSAITKLRALRKALGPEYRICRIDLEQCLYRDYGNDFDLEVSEVLTTKEDHPAVLYLWYTGNKNSPFIMKVLHGVPRSEIGNYADRLKEYSNDLLRRGYNDEAKLWKVKQQLLKERRQHVHLERGETLPASEEIHE